MSKTNNKESEEAIKRIKILMQDDCNCEECIKNKKAYKSILNYIENSISKEVIKEKKQKLEKEYKEYLEENSTKAFILKCQLELINEMLEEK